MIMSSVVHIVHDLVCINGFCGVFLYANRKEGFKRLAGSLYAGCSSERIRMFGFVCLDRKSVV